MGTTPAYGLPYPEGTDLVIAGDDAIQALAERLEALLVPAYGHTDPAASATQNGIVGGTVATFAGWLSNTGQFSFEGAGATIRYTGPSRWFHVDIEMAYSTAGGVSGGASAGLYQEGVLVAKAEQSILVGGATAALWGMLRVSTTCRLSNGHALQVLLAGGAGGASFGDKRARITSIGVPQ